MILSTILISALLTTNALTCVTVVSELPVVEMTQQTVVFRGIQKLRSNDGREIYFYPSGTCEGYYGDRLEFSCKYRLQSGEVRLLDENGNTVYKGTYRMKSDGRNLSNVSIAGTTYWAQ